MKKMKLVLVGNGMAGVRTLEELLQLAPDLYDITVFGDEPYGNYNRILLSPVLAGEQTVDDIMLNGLDWYAEKGITLHTHARVVRIDRKQRLVHADNGMTAAYDRLILATGSNPYRLPVPGNDLDGVVSFRDIRDVTRMIAAARRGGDAVVIGAGLLGLEAASGLAARGMKVSVVHSSGTIMNRQLDPSASALLQKSLAEKGMVFQLNKKTAEIMGEGGRVTAVRFAQGELLPADLVVMAAGIRPNTELAAAAGLYCDGGIVVNDTMQTFDPRIYAVGECVAHRGRSYGLVAPLFEMAKICANHLAQLGFSRYTGSASSTKLKVTGIDVFSAGNFMGDAATEEILMQDPTAGVYKKLVLKDNRLVGAVLYGDTVDGAWYFQLLREGRSVADIRNTLMFGQKTLGDAGHQGQTSATAMPDDMEVCGCNGVCKGDIVQAIKTKGLFTLAEVKKQTKASASCGSCAGLVEQILASTLGGDYSLRPAATGMCGCTDYPHEEVRRVIREQHLLTLPDVMRFMDWRTPDGCSTCRPALNYYLISTWPHEARDDPQAHFINERAHANIQKDGTFSVVPRMYGGVTSPAQLRRIADVAEKYQVPMVKVTGGQRIDLLGVKKEDLPAIWAELDMPSGHAYGKALRTVKTCVGREFCRFGTQDSTAMGIRLEQAFERMWAPHKVKLAVSGCPRNCAESTIKDVGVIAVDAGWEIYIAGNGGIKAEVAQFLVKVKTTEEVLEYSGAFLQLYREEARYLDRTVHWVGRVGLDYVKKRICNDAASRKALYERLLYALQGERDPWQAAARDEFEPLTI
jgi:nitrite reductase (NADH) large subunit